MILIPWSSQFWTSCLTNLWLNLQNNQLPLFPPSLLDIERPSNNRITPKYWRNPPQRGLGCAFEILLLSKVSNCRRILHAFWNSFDTNLHSLVQILHGFLLSFISTGSPRSAFCLASLFSIAEAEVYLLNKWKILEDRRYVFICIFITI